MTEQTIEQQLVELAANPVVDGVRWLLIKEQGCTVGATAMIDVVELRVVSIPLLDKWKVDFGGIVTNYYFECTGDVRREAIRICRERVAELAAALNMIPNEADINTAAEIAAGIESPTAQYLAACYFNKGAQYVINFNQPTQGAKTEQ